MTHHHYNLLENVAAISAEFHTHRSYGAFYDTFGKYIDGFVGNYSLCIDMAEALTNWENGNGGPDAYENHGTPWIEIVERYVAAMIDRSLETGGPLNPGIVLRDVLRKGGAS